MPLKVCYQIDQLRSLFSHTLAVGSLFLAMFAESSAQDVEDFDSVFDLVSECDILAAHPDDPQRMTEGVDDGDIVPALAIIACQRLLEETPDSARANFQLARAYLAQDEKLKARNSLVRAAQEGYAPALAYLGDFYQFGWTLDPDLEKARKFYQQAIDGGFVIAEDQILQLTFEKENYASKLIGSLYDDPLAVSVTSASEKRGLWERTYLFSFHQSLVDECELRIERDAVLLPYLFRFPGDLNPELEDDVFISVWEDLGLRDAGHFVDVHGCDGPVTSNMIASFGTLLSREASN